VVRAARSDDGGVVASLGGGLMGHVRVFGCRSGMASVRLEGAGVTVIQRRVAAKAAGY
jgi:hypothetical protein